MAAGQDPEAFWRTTPRVLVVVFAGATERLEREQQGRAWLAWHTAALARLSKFPDLLKLMGIKRTVRAQTPQELEANIRRMFT